MPFIDDSAYDAALAAIIAGGTRLHLCSAEPTSYAQAVSLSLGYKDTPSLGAASDRAGGGRKTTVAAITDGVQSAAGTATHWALVNVAGTKLWATNALAASKVMAGSGTWTSTAFDIGVADAVTA